jgi:hypothetical protein
MSFYIIHCGDIDVKSIVFDISYGAVNSSWIKGKGYPPLGGSKRDSELTQNWIEERSKIRAGTAGR